MGRGRPAKVTQQTFIDTVVKYKDKIYVNSNIVVKENEVWKIISKEFNNLLLGTSIHSMVVGNRYQVLDKLNQTDKEPQDLTFEDDTQNDSFSSKSSESSDLLNASDLEKIYNQKCVEFQSEIDSQKLEELTTVFDYSRNTRKSTVKKRKYRRFITGVYQPFFAKQILENTQLICGWNFQNQHVNMPATQGKIDSKYSLN